MTSEDFSQPWSEKSQTRDEKSQTRVEKNQHKLKHITRQIQQSRPWKTGGMEGTKLERKRFLEIMFCVFYV